MVLLCGFLIFHPLITRMKNDYASRILFGYVFLTAFIGGFVLGVLDAHFGEGEGSEGFGEYLAGTEVHLGTLDEALVVVFLGEGTLAVDGHLEGAEVAQTDDFAVLQGFGNHVFECHEDGIYITLVDGTGALDTFRHFADADIATGLSLGIIARRFVLVAWVTTRDNGVGY